MNVFIIIIIFNLLTRQLRVFILKVILHIDLITPI